MAVENINDFFDMVKEQKKVAAEIKAEKWVVVTIEATVKPGERQRFYRYELPEHLAEKYDWVIRWRKSRLQCLYPRLTMTTYHAYYFRKGNVIFEYNNSLLSKYIAMKAQVSRAKTKVSDYVKSQSASLFFDPDNDELLQKALAKVKDKETKLAQLELEIEQVIKNHHSRQK